MKLAVSNIAWRPAEDIAIAALLRREGIGAVELAPTAWRERPLDAAQADVLALRRWWQDHGIAIVSLQSLLFGRPELQLFGSDSTRAAMLDHLRRTVDFAALLGARALVFGSPRNRRRGSMPLHDALSRAADFLHAVGEYAHDRGVALCIEANPPAYGCDFITTTAEAVDLCRTIAHPGVRVNGDLGGMTLSQEEIAQSISLAVPLLGHFHASEPHLVETGSEADHARAGAALRAAGYGEWVSIEMRAAEEGENAAAVARALRRAKADYRESETAPER
ncbi:MAG TPA: sugar phosphate isomerase/epimerase family protein [Gemmatimonadaceae bacterium]|nr:sugar phosphate isomerase/epimerase family protein [Gemmatimonadaceae bacterium]